MSEAAPAVEALYEVYAIRYAHAPRRRRDNLLPPDAHDGPMPMAFYVWLLKSAERSILIDTGFNAATGVARGREFLRCPIEALRTLGVAPEQVQDVVLTHLHYDHAGNLGKLPHARFHVQDQELSFSTGRCMCDATQRHAYAVEDVVALVRHVYADRVVFHAGDSTLCEGVELMLIGGHTQGLQAVRVRTARGWVVLASDAAHYYENVERGLAYPLVFNLADMLAGHGKVSAAADSPQHLVPGHDPLVIERYPCVAGDAVGIAQLHLAPHG